MVEAGDTSALYPAAQMIEQSDDLPAAIEYYRRAAEAGDPHGHDLFARLSLTYARALRKADDLDGAVTHGRNSAEAGVRYAWSATATYLVDSGCATEAFAWLRRHAEAGNVDAAQQLAWQAVRAHDLVLADEALVSLRAHAEAGDKTALAAIPRLLVALDRPEEAFAAELWATEAGCVGALDRLHRLDLPQRLAADLERMHKYAWSREAKSRRAGPPAWTGSGDDSPAGRLMCCCYSRGVVAWQTRWPTSTFAAPLSTTRTHSRAPIG